MTKYFYILILAFLFPTVCLAVPNTNNETFESGPFDLKWDYTLQDTQFLYTDGLTYPLDSNEYPTQYALPKNLPLFWAGIPVEQVLLNFNSDGNLRRAFLLFKYSDLDLVRNRSIQVFSQNYKSKEINERTTMYWRTSKNIVVNLSLSKRAPFQWVVLAFETVTPAKKN